MLLKKPRKFQTKISPVNPGRFIREMMDDRQCIAGRLSGVVEVDEAFFSGKPKFRHGVENKRGRGTCKPIALVAAARNG